MELCVQVGDVTRYMPCEAILTMVDADNSCWHNPTDEAIRRFMGTDWFHAELHTQLMYNRFSNVVVVENPLRVSEGFRAVVFTIDQHETGVTTPQFLRRGLDAASRHGFTKVAVSVEAWNYDMLTGEAFANAVDDLLSPVVGAAYDPANLLERIALVVDDNARWLAELLRERLYYYHH